MAANPQELKRFVRGFRGVRYQVAEISRSIEFYTAQLGFNLEKQHHPEFAEVSAGDLRLILSAPGASGSRAMPSGEHQAPGGWNRVILQVDDLAARIVELKEAGVKLRNELEQGPGGKQIQIEDPDGNPIELFEPAQ